MAISAPVRKDTGCWMTAKPARVSETDRNTTMMSSAFGGEDPASA